MSLVALVTLLLVSRRTAGDDQLEFFEAKVRPVLIDHCYQCHSQQAEKIKGGLLLDSRDGLLKGGDSGPAVLPGDPEHSLIIKAIRYTDDNLQMPPKNKKLKPEQIKALEDWVRLGAPAPSAITNRQSQIKKTKHWAFQPVQRPSVPEVANKAWIQEPIDNFILAKLEAKGIMPSPKTDKRALIRRVTFDLTGLPPTAQEVQSFLADQSPDAFATVVDRLLASPRYGERWARHWLDVARYADTKGYVFEEERRYPYAYTYRDYVIRAFNEDLPFNEFIIEQIAADQLPLGEDKHALAALGYLTLGRRFLNNQQDIIDDRIDVVTRGMMGLTVGCARCHDHKFDPISTKDYYALSGVFASCSEPEEKPLLGTGTLPPSYSAYLAEHEKRLAELNTFRDTKEAEIRRQLRDRAGDYMLTAHDAEALGDHSKAEGLARERKLDPRTVERWSQALKNWGTRPQDPVFGLWLALADCSDADLPEHVNELLADLSSGANSLGPINPLVEQAFRAAPPRTLREAADRYNDLFTEVDRIWEPGPDSQPRRDPKQPSAATATSKSDLHPRSESRNGPPTTAPLPDPALEELRQVLFASDSPTLVPPAEITRLFDVPSIQKIRALKRRVEELDATDPGAPPRAMALQDDPTPQTPYVLIRGNPNNKGPEVPRRFVEILGGGKPFEKGSGRLELAQAIASRNNPLTARVLVNRVWLHYFGAGLVRTPSDFGLRSDPPSHPELLDYLAARFMEGGWSLKRLHRWIVLSSTYQQSSDERPTLAQADPSNQLLWKMNRRRLDFEAFRDSLLEVGGQLDLAMGGHSIDILTPPYSGRRSVYAFIERQNLPGLFRTFDFASPDTTSPQRFSTTVPQQALFMMNSPFLAVDARGLLGEKEVCHASCETDRVRALYRTLFQREPSTHEVDLALKFLHNQAGLEPSAPETAAWHYGYGEYDPAEKRLVRFEPLPRFSDGAWRAEAGSISLKANGGTPGADHQHAVIRRWVAPRAMTVTISGTLRHDSDKGDGVQAWIVANGAEELATWTVQKGKQDTALAQLEVTKGKTIDFIVAGRNNSESDAFSWAPVIKRIDPEADARAGLLVEWDAGQDFSGPQTVPQPLSAWERYAQVLLMSNEFAFVD